MPVRSLWHLTPSNKTPRTSNLIFSWHYNENTYILKAITRKSTRQITLKVIRLLMFFTIFFALTEFKVSCTFKLNLLSSG